MILIKFGVLENGRANSAIFNEYHECGGKLGAHFDTSTAVRKAHHCDQHLLREEFVLWRRGWGMTPQGLHYAVKMPRGTVTIMEGFAANGINHGIRSVGGRVAALVLRRMHLALSDPEWDNYNTMRCIIEAPVRPRSWTRSTIRARS